MKLELHDNIQFIYEWALAELELRSFGINFQVENSLRTFNAQSIPDKGILKKRLAYFQTVDGEYTDYFHIQKYNRTRSVNQYLTHWFYPYKGKFHPQMIRSLLNAIQMKEGETVLDPFVGSGTTAIEAMLQGIDCIGIDVSPLCVLISKVKTQSVAILDEIRSEAPFIRPSGEKHPQRVLFEYRPIYGVTNERVREFFLLAEMISHSDEARRRKDFFRSFRVNIDRMVASVQDFKDMVDKYELSLGKPTILKGDARHLELNNNSIDGIVTSPPYSIALDYVQNDAHSLSALGYDLGKIKDDFIGVRGTNKEKFLLYNEDMGLCYSEMYRVLKPGRFCVIIIGNVTFQDEEVDTTSMTVNSCERVGFKLVKKVGKIIFGLYSVMQKEYILIFKK